MEYLALYPWFEALSPEHIAAFVLAALMPLAFALFIFGTLLTAVLRLLGLSHPNHYRFLPRLPWRSVYKVKMAVSQWFEQNFRFGRHSTGSFAGSLSLLTLIFKPKQLFLGRAPIAGFGTMQPVGTDVKTHFFCYAASGAGKTTWLITALSCWNGSAWIIDPKGQVTDALARSNKKRDWIILNPYDIENTAQWNPFDDIKAAMLRENEDAAVKWAMRLGEALVITPEGSKQPYFTDTSRGFVVGLVLHIITYHEQECWNLAYLRELIIFGYRVFDEHGNLESTSGESRELLYKLMHENHSFDFAVAGSAAAFINASADVSGNLLSTLMEQTKWLDIPSVKHMLSATTRPLSDAKTRDDVVFSLVLPVLSIREELQPLVRAYTNFTVYTFESIKKKKGQCLMCIDEIQAQNYNKTIDISLPVGRSYGLTVLGIAQDISGMKAKSAYQDTWEAFTGNASAVLWMGSNHSSNLDYLSKILGKKTIIEKDRRTGKKIYREVPVMDAEQIARLLDPDRGNVIVTRAGKRPLLLKNDPYFKALPVTKYDADPEHGDSFWRAITRFFLNRKPKAVKRDALTMQAGKDLAHTKNIRGVNNDEY